MPSLLTRPCQRIIVDTCIGNDKSRSIPPGPSPASLLGGPGEGGLLEETIDTVLCTHLHVDHVGWNTMLVG